MTTCARAGGCAGTNYSFLTRKERDNETGLDYFLARYYSSTQGRFTSPDEFTGGPDELYDFVDAASENPTFYADLHNPQSLNKYQYVYNNPLSYVDPDGHAPNDKPLTAHIDDVEAEKRWKQWQKARAETHQGLGLFQKGGPRNRGSNVGNRANPKRDPRNWDYRGGGRYVYVGPGSWTYGTGKPPAPVRGIGFGSFSSFKRAFGPAGPNREWHHIVEQTPGNIARFGPQAIHNTLNIYMLDYRQHRRISGYYSSIQPFTNGKTVREWLSTQSYQAQRDFGINLLNTYYISTW